MKQLHKWSFGTFALSALMLAACGNGADEQNDSSSTTEGTETIPYEAMNGVQEIPANPERVVLLADVYFGYLQELGIDVAAATDYVFESPFLEAYTEGVENLGDASTVSVEQVLELDPDLIIAYGSSEILDQLESIATTVAVDYASLGYKDQLIEFGEMFGREEAAQSWIDEWDAQVEDLKPDVQAAVGDSTISILQPTDSDVYLYGSGWGRGGEIMYNEFDLSMPEAAVEAVEGDGYNNLSLEAVPDYAGDYILTAPWTVNMDGNFLYESSIWEGLEAVENDRVFEMDPIGYYFNDPISVEQHLNEISEFLLNQ
ncbi:MULTISPECIES: ABC transporter substrate-binding protein [Shouchella]|uniref:ABC transporter substrate-binding protein n=2 Tax=Shouchella TaxID=2893057 RepID=A0ABY7W9W0_9BACI|nr:MULTISPECIES: ABC transporter substrate-binding protein [Shouchella]MED4126669.1 ABC transporter substrate-binding protein [Shouchella miscanthi]WDF04630.1 ABC transporter substrate-binding protein [Shouchella hunanensis]